MLDPDPGGETNADPERWFRLVYSVCEDFIIIIEWLGCIRYGTAFQHLSLFGRIFKKSNFSVFLSFMYPRYGTVPVPI